MRRLALLGLFAGLLAAVPVTHDALADNHRMAICHVNSANDRVVTENGEVVQVGRIIMVARRSVRAHLRHGDSLRFFELDEETRDWAEIEYGVSLPNGNCYFFLVGPF